MGISEAGAALIAAGVSAAAGAGGTAYTVHQQKSAAEKAFKPGTPPQPQIGGAQSTQSAINAQQTQNQQAGAFLNNPAVSSAPNAQKKSLLGQ